MSGIDNEWQQWLDRNLARGCDQKELCTIMLQNGFRHTEIKQMMGDAYPEQMAVPETNTDIDYLALTNTVDHSLKMNNATIIENDLMQLYTIDTFLTAEECELLIQQTEANLRPSEVSHDNGDQAFRTSETCHLDDQNDVFIKYIDEKIAKAIGIRLPYSEPIQAQRYVIGQEFKPHHDYFSPDIDAYEEFTKEMGQRTWTFMIYLNDTPKGGGTHFVHLDHIFYPKCGTAVIWNNLYSDGLPNRHTLHHGMPVEEGKKAIITKWFRERGNGDMFY